MTASVNETTGLPSVRTRRKCVKFIAVVDAPLHDARAFGIIMNDWVLHSDFGHVTLLVPFPAEEIASGGFRHVGQSLLVAPGTAEP